MKKVGRPKGSIKKISLKPDEELTIAQLALTLIDLSNRQNQTSVALNQNAFNLGSILNQINENQEKFFKRLATIEKRLEELDDLIVRLNIRQNISPIEEIN